MSGKKSRGSVKGSDVIRVVGQIDFLMVSDEFAVEDEITLTGDKVLSRIHEITDGAFGNVNSVFQNGVCGVSIFDFGNHARRQKAALLVGHDYLTSIRATGFAVNWCFDYSDDETGDYFTVQSKTYWP
jgi:hypothetical protein